MSFHLVLFSAAVIIASVFPWLPPLWWLLILPASLCLLPWRYGSYCLALVLGLAWGIFSGHNMMATQLSEEWAGKDLLITGSVQGLPEQDERRLRFAFRVKEVSTLEGELISLDPFPEKIHLSWYQYRRDGKAIEVPELAIGDHWQLQVRLKPPRGFVNPAGFDYQAWLLRQGIGATGYVSGQARPLTNPSTSFVWNDWIDRQRYQLQQWILARSDSSERGILIALLIGDSALVDKNQWQRMQRTGTSHLIAISGLHVGFLAIFGFYFGLWLGKCVQLIWHRCPALMIAWLCAIACASFYSALAGFNIPTVRTLIMLSLFYGACLWRRSIHISDIFCCALALVVLLDPLAAFDLGFWLSFGAVALLLFYFSGRRIAKVSEPHWSGYSFIDMLSGFIRSQWVMFIGLLIPLSVLVSSVSLVAPVANAIAIPLITFFVVPMLLAGAALKDMFTPLGDFLLNAAGSAMEWLKIILQWILDVAGDYASPVIAFSPVLSFLVALSCFVLLLPKGLLPRFVGWAGLIVGALCVPGFSALTKPDLKISFMDVGQGTAVVVQVKDKTLIYDTGPKFTDNFNAGSAILTPYLFSQAISRVDLLVVSHDDMDHAGGMNGLLERISADQILISDPLHINVPAQVQSVTGDCHQQRPWQWNEVNFEFLPLAISPYTKDNNKSCVLLIRYLDQTILLPGDIESRVENHLLDDEKIPQHLTVLLAAHHGSRTSSSVRFVNFTRPQYVVYSAGYRSQHGHPHPHVRERFQALQTRELNTAESGAIIFEWSVSGNLDVYEYRNEKRRYWFQ